MNTAALAFGILHLLVLKSDMGVGRTLARFEIGRTSIRQVVATCRTEDPRASILKESGDGAPVSITTRLPGRGCIIWRAGPLGGWDVLTSVVIQEDDPSCSERFSCYVASPQAIGWLEQLSQLVSDGWRDGGRAGATIEQERLSASQDGKFVFHTLDLLRARRERGRCVQLERAVLTEVERSGVADAPVKGGGSTR